MSNFENYFALNRAFFVCMDLLKKKILEISSFAAERHNLFLIEVIVRGHEKNRVIEIFYDSVDHLSAEKCALVSREIEEEIDKNGLVKGQYRLEVSSPGVERPLKYAGQYPKHINRHFEISYKQEDDEKKLKGKLKSIEGNDFFFETDKKDIVKINYNNITKAKVNISFS
jgi:ribosome maturation factor RimP